MLELLLAVFPFLLVSYLLLVRDVRADVVLLLAYVFTAASLLIVWNSSFAQVLSSSIKGVLLAVDVILIIAGILLVFSLLKEKGHLDHLEEFFINTSSKPPVHVILIGFFFVMFLEGIAGFGIPALIAAPLLVLAGVKKLPAIVISLFSDSVAVVFGAFGTPFVVGLSEVSAVAPVVFSVGAVGALLMLITPLLLLALHAVLEKRPISTIRPYVPLALVSGLVSALVFFLCSWLLGPELPSVLASLVGLFVVLSLLQTTVLGVRIRKPSIRKAVPALLSYGVIIVLLLSSRLDVFGFGSVLQSISWTFSVGVFSHSFSAYHPGALIFLSFFILLAAVRPNKETLRAVGADVYAKALRVSVTLLFTLMFVQLIIGSSDPSIPLVLAQPFAQTGNWYVLFSSLLGAFGSFVAGSATVSNLMLFSLHLDAAALNGLSKSLVLSAQVLGAGAGNLIAIHNVLAVLAVVHLHGGMRKVLRINVVLALLLCAVSSALLVALWSLGLF